MEPQVFINIKDIQKCNNNIVKRLKSLNDCTKSTCQQCPLDIARIAKDVADLETRMETLTAHTDDTNESDIARRFDDIKSQLDDIQRLLHFPDANHESKNVTRIIRQHKKYYIPGREDTWRAVADKSQERALPNTVRSRFITMVLCLDISESMSSNNGWGQTLEFVNDFLTEGLILGGPSPLYGGLLISMATAHIAKRRYVPNINGLNLSPRIIVITDGCPTDTMLHAGPDIQDESKVEQTESHLAEAVEEIDKRDFELFFIGVGKCRKTFIQNMSTLCQSKIYSYKDGRRLARFGFFESQLATHGLALTFSLTNRLSVWDEDDIKFIRADTKRRCERQYGPLCQESNDASLLSLGTRVRRGLAWNDGNFDLNGPGTVTGHFDGKLLVTWDLNDHTSSYRYTRECCEVQAVDEPRVLNPAERMETGCKVKPGGDCVSREIGNSNRGVVLRVETPHATIRWDNGHIGKYCYGVDTKIEIELEQMSTPEGV
ncbi:uncharacterized protein LOC127854026 isoform X2 [Dreissena polymorpha]|uniref:uncharacterized protein LOC127854026 isoform X2 n=1 Tax=Dreissena polymorpha TaxID=45954 RepID=UPI002263CEC9|nr:uncharacterized protein LOC127854026 isoform X2 [Dreissena polymorpha]